MADPTSGVMLRSPDGVEYRFDPGALCLEFLTTGGPGALGRYEALHEPADLARWMALSRLRLESSRIEVSPQELTEARRVRDALWRLAVDRAHGRLV
jgi:hypothetical protein